MNPKEEKVIMYASDEAAKKMTVTGWVGGGRYWGNDEHMARWSGCTHTLCECGAVIPIRSYTICETCRAKTSDERYKKLPYKEWNGVDPVTEMDGDKYFFNLEDLQEYMEENEMTEIDLLFCDELHWQQIEEDFWSDNAPEDWDGDLPKEMQKKLDELNAIIKGLGPQSYGPGKIRTSYTHIPEPETE